jgi:hypothetical protein
MKTNRIGKVALLEHNPEEFANIANNQVTPSTRSALESVRTPNGHIRIISQNQ